MNSIEGDPVRFGKSCIRAYAASVSPGLHITRDLAIKTEKENDTDRKFPHRNYEPYRTCY
ncbi:hypothetical protein LEP1GSC058_1188 [Leptospira fainei serovar Hurstbridge str. BUT 6]|uniref:Uncharacterized protein n=1 Tax=Leptospira fainei serovar Hurstbridge str. BUT 6 TaxID=1193011 RepID=S3VIH1_9LEPT|nr:hypothetical protein LEP1GSC058_1188 [Leptospira fainei serovar Hurstbridge str. BUT 6]